MPRPKKQAVETPPTDTPQAPPSDVGYATPTGVAINRDNVNVEVTDEERDRFFKCFISNEVFEDSKPLFDGKVNIVFKSITVDENNDIWRQIDLDTRSGVVSTNTEAYFLLINVYRLAMSLASIDGLPFSDVTKESFTKDEKKPYITYVKAKADQFKDWHTFKLSSFIKAFNEFENKLFQLEKDVTTQNFWKAAAQG